MVFDEFRLLVRPSLTNPAEWQIEVANCPVPGMSGSRYCLAPRITADQLAWLRKPTSQPDEARMRQIGAAVLETIMPSEVRAAFDFHLAQLDPAKGLRLVVSMIGDPSLDAEVGVTELPLEAIFSDKFYYLATDVRTPVSRGIKRRPEREPVSVALPLRILVVVSEPADMPPVNADAERAAIEGALAPLVQNGAVQVEYCDGDAATMTALDAKLRQGFHIVHFIGHGDFEIAGADPSPQPHLYFVDGTPNRSRRAANVEQIFTILRNGNVPLMVMTACSSAAEMPQCAKYPGLAFESLARALSERTTGPLAVVAMQFDLETRAAAVFSGALYGRLFEPGMCLDSAVAYARSQMLLCPFRGHRSWVNPTVYWGCREGKVFKFLSMRGELSLPQREAALQIEAMRKTYEKVLDDLAHQPPGVRASVESLAQKWRDSIQSLFDERGRVLGDTVRLRGGLPGADGKIKCELTMRTRMPVQVDEVRATVRFDAAEFSYFGYSNVPGGPDVFVHNTPNEVTVIVPQTSKAAVWDPGEHSVATLYFKCVGDLSKPLSYLEMHRASVRVAGVAACQEFPTLDGIVFFPRSCE